MKQKENRTTAVLRDVSIHASDPLQFRGIITHSWDDIGHSVGSLIITAKILRVERGINTGNWYALGVDHSIYLLEDYDYEKERLLALDKDLLSAEGRHQQHLFGPSGPPRRSENA